SGGVEEWRSGEVEKLRNGEMEEWRSGEVEVCPAFSALMFVLIRLQNRTRLIAARAEDRNLRQIKAE
ncbi:uncharacterized, partial [Tachysurus ichikawai]